MAYGYQGLLIYDAKDIITSNFVQKQSTFVDPQINVFHLSTPVRPPWSNLSTKHNFSDHSLIENQHYQYSSIFILEEASIQARYYEGQINGQSIKSELLNFIHLAEAKVIFRHGKSGNLRTQFSDIFVGISGHFKKKGIFLPRKLIN